MSAHGFRAMLALALLLPATAAFADSRSDWQGYDWQTVSRDTCPDLGADGPCHFFSAKWDWKRNQWVHLELSKASGKLRVRELLDNKDRKDGDNVCTVVLLQNADRANVAVLFFNEHSDAQTIHQAERDVPVTSSAASAIVALTVGTKQCREGRSQDKALYERVLSELQ